MIDRLLGTEAIGHIAPRNAGIEYPEDAVDHSTMVGPAATATNVVWQQWLKCCPLLISWRFIGISSFGDANLRLY